MNQSRIRDELFERSDRLGRDLSGFSNIEIIDFEANDGFMDRALETLGRAFGESPSDSSARTSLKKTVLGFEGQLRIYSSVGSFVADVIGDDPMSVVQHLSRKIRTQLRIWKRTRSFDYAT